jgi:hypothetical protein
MSGRKSPRILTLAQMEVLGLDSIFCRLTEEGRAPGTDRKGDRTGARFSPGNLQAGSRLA